MTMATASAVKSKGTKVVRERGVNFTLPELSALVDLVEANSGVFLILFKLTDLIVHYLSMFMIYE